MPGVALIARSRSQAVRLEELVPLSGACVVDVSPERRRDARLSTATTRIHYHEVR